MLRKGGGWAVPLAIAVGTSTKDCAFVGKLRLPTDTRGTTALVRVKAHAGEATAQWERDSKGQWKAQVELCPDSNPQLSLLAEAAQSRPGTAVKGSLSVAQAFSNYRYRLRMSEGPLFTYSAVVGFPRLGAGCSVAYNWRDSSLAHLKWACYFGRQESRIVVQSVKEKEEVAMVRNWSLTFLRQFSSSTTLACRVVRESPSRLHGELAVLIDFSPTRSMTVKLTSDRAFSYLSRLKLWQYVTVKFGVRIPAKAGGPENVQTGIKIKVSS